MIISACKKETPILAFSETGVFDFNPQLSSQNGLNIWIENRKQSIQELKNNQTVDISDNIAEHYIL